MTTKHFRQLAALCNRIAEGPRSIGVEKLAHELAAICEEANPRFNRPTFFVACGLTAEGTLATN